jgi:fatty-acyl-CoA synthase
MGFIDTLSREVDYVTTLRRTQKWIKGLDPDASGLLADDWEAICDRFGAKTAVEFESRSLTYGQFDGLANRFAHWALAQGLVAGDVVALFMGNRPEYLACWYGLAKVGVVSALINHNLQGHSLAHCVNVAKARAVIVDGELTDLWVTAAEMVGDVPVWSTGGAGAGRNDLDRALNAQSIKRPPRHHREGLRGKDACLYVYTSGTTGNPKAATLTNMRTQGMSRAFIAGTRMTERDKIYVPLPLYHGTGGICGVGLAFNTGGTLVLRRKFSASQFWDDIVDRQCTVFAYIGELFRYLVAADPHPKERAHKLKSCFGNGLRADVWARAEERFAIPRIVEFYGSTEGNVSFINAEGKLGAVGRVPNYLRKQFNFELLKFDVETEQPVRGPDGRCIRCEPNEVGEAVGKIAAGDARARFDGYANDPEASNRKLLRDVLEEGDLYFRTGDLLRQDEAGYLYFVDRVGDTYRWKSENVSTNEVSEALCMFDGIEQANVYGVDVPHADGRAGMAAVVAPDGVDLAALSAHVRRELPAYAVPVFIRFQTEVEVTGTFKYRKVELVKEGFDPARIADPMCWMNPATGLYEPLDAAAHAKILAGETRL